MSRSKQWDREAIIAAIQKWEGIHGRPPTTTDWNPRVEGYPSLGSVFGWKRPFRRWSEAIKAAGFSPGRRGRRPPDDLSDLIISEPIPEDLRLGVPTKTDLQVLGETDDDGDWSINTPSENRARVAKAQAAKE